MLQNIKDKFINIYPEDVIQDARDEDLDVTSIEDFRNMAPHYDRIESMMDNYRSSFANTSILGGLTSGIGGLMTAITFATVDTISLSLQLYRLSQRFAILNGFDGSDPLQQDKMLNIYFESLSLNAVTQAALKHELLKASAVAGTRHASDSMVLRAIVNIGKVMGKKVSSRRAGRMVPIFGGIVGATVNYSFARKTSHSMKKAYKHAYFETWQ